jgi:hypothetical protein
MPYYMMPQAKKLSIRYLLNFSVGLIMLFR